jgi:competence protein ComEC
VGGILENTHLVSSDGAVSYVREALHRLRYFLIQKSDQLFSKPYNGIIQVVLLGYKGNLDADMKQLYKEGGMLHIMTISGMHISMLGMGCVWVLKKVLCLQIENSQALMF